MGTCVERYAATFCFVAVICNMNFSIELNQKFKIYQGIIDYFILDMDMMISDVYGNCRDSFDLRAATGNRSETILRPKPRGKFRCDVKRTCRQDFYGARSD